MQLTAIAGLLLASAAARAEPLTPASCDTVLERATAELRAGETMHAQRYSARLQKCLAIYKADLKEKAAVGVVEAKKIIADYEAGHQGAQPSVK